MGTDECPASPAMSHNHMYPDQVYGNKVCQSADNSDTHLRMESCRKQLLLRLSPVFAVRRGHGCSRDFTEHPVFHHHCSIKLHHPPAVSRGTPPHSLTLPNQKKKDGLPICTAMQLGLAESIAADHSKHFSMRRTEQDARNVGRGKESGSEQEHLQAHGLAVQHRHLRRLVHADLVAPQVREKPVTALSLLCYIIYMYILFK